MRGRSWRRPPWGMSWAGWGLVVCAACAAPPTRPTPTAPLVDLAPVAQETAKETAKPRLAVTLGRRSLDDATFWEPVEDQGVLGLLWDRPDERGLG